MVQTGIFEEREKWGRDILRSVGAHILLIASLIGGGMFGGPHGENWGGSTSGEAMQVNLTSAVPLPAPQEPTQNIVATENMGLTQSIPQQAEEQPEAVPIPDKQTKKRPDKTPITQNIKPPQPVTPPKDNVVPYGEGGPISGPY